MDCGKKGEKKRIEEGGPVLAHVDVKQLAGLLEGTTCDVVDTVVLCCVVFVLCLCLRLRLRLCLRLRLRLRLRLCLCLCFVVC